MGARLVARQPRSAGSTATQGSGKVVDPLHHGGRTGRRGGRERPVPNRASTARSQSAAASRATRRSFSLPISQDLQLGLAADRQLGRRVRRQTHGLLVIRKIRTSPAARTDRWRATARPSAAVVPWAAEESPPTARRRTPSAIASTDAGPRRSPSAPGLGHPQILDGRRDPTLAPWPPAVSILMRHPQRLRFWILDFGFAIERSPGRPGATGVRRAAEVVRGHPGGRGGGGLREVSTVGRPWGGISTARPSSAQAGEGRGGGPGSVLQAMPANSRRPSTAPGRRRGDQVVGRPSFRGAQHDRRRRPSTRLETRDAPDPEAASDGSLPQRGNRSPAPGPPPPSGECAVEPPLPDRFPTLPPPPARRPPGSPRRRSSAQAQAQLEVPAPQPVRAGPPGTPRGAPPALGGGKISDQPRSFTRPLAGPAW